MSAINQCVAPGAGTGLERVVFALAGESRERFLPLFHAGTFPQVDYHWLDMAGMNRYRWEEALLEMKPTVLVTGWRSLRIPSSYVETSDLSLRYVCHLAGTVREFIPRSLIERGVLVSNWGTSISHTVAEHAVLLTFGALRNQTVWRSYLDAWPSCGGVSPRTAVRTRSLRGKQLGIHGFGAVARELIKMLQPFGVAISAYSSGVPAHLFEEYGVRRSKNLSELFSTSDIIIECEALTPTSKGSINEEVLRCLPDGAVFVNVGRGDVVDEEALVRVAAERDLRLGIDVFSHEPLAGDSPLRTLPQALLSPHIAGPTEDSFADLWEFAMSNLRRYLAGESIEGLVTLEVFDRST